MYSVCTYTFFCFVGIRWLFLSYWLGSISTVCLAIPHYLAMSSNLNRPPSCWIVDWTPRQSSTSCLFPSCTGEWWCSAIVYLLMKLATEKSTFPSSVLEIKLHYAVDMFCFYSPRLSKLPGWSAKDGTLNLEKVGLILVDYEWCFCFVLHLYCQTNRWLWNDSLTLIFPGAERVCRQSVCGLTARVLSPRGITLRNCMQTPAFIFRQNAGSQCCKGQEQCLVLYYGLAAHSVVIGM